MTRKPSLEPDPLVRTSMDALRRIVRALRLAAVEVERETGISFARLFVLEQLADGRPRSINQLAEATATDPSTVSGVVKHLVAARLVRRKASADDGRRAEVSLTPSGERLLARAPRVPQEKMVAAINALSVEKRQVLAEALLEIADQLGPVPVTFFFEEESRRRT